MKTGGALCSSRIHILGILLLDFVLLDNTKDFFQGCAIRVNVQIDGLGKIKAEDSHDGFGIDYIASRNQIEITVESADFIDESLYFVDGIE